MVGWPDTPEELARVQHEIAAADPPPWTPGPRRLVVAACYVCFRRPFSGWSEAGEPAWAGAALTRGCRFLADVTVVGRAGAPYAPGLLALREGRVLEAAVRALPQVPDVVIANATGRDHPRRCGLAMHLGAVLDLPSVGVTDRPLCARGAQPAPERAATAALYLGGEVVGYRVRTRPGGRPVTVSAGWRSTPETAVAVALAAVRRARTPEPLRRARTAARQARAGLRAPLSLDFD